jgi:MFS family permease
MSLPRDQRKMGLVPTVVFFCFLLSGLSSLIYEVLWMRMLILIFGSTTFAISTVLTAFMGGLALGSYLCGRFIDRSRHPIPIYGVLETGIGIYALLVPTIFSSLFPLYQALWQALHLSFYLFSLMQFVLVTLVLILPTTLMGATLPILGKYYSYRQDKLGWTIGTLYAINTLGGILGTFLSGFFLLPTLGVRMTTFRSVRDILSHFVFGTWEVPAYVKNALINTDDNALLEFSAPSTLYIDTSEANFQELSRYSRGAAPYLRH